MQKGASTSLTARGARGLLDSLPGRILPGLAPGANGNRHGPPRRTRARFLRPRESTSRRPPRKSSACRRLPHVVDLSSLAESPPPAASRTPSEMLATQPGALEQLGVASAGRRPRPARPWAHRRARSPARPGLPRPGDRARTAPRRYASPAPRRLAVHQHGQVAGQGPLRGPLVRPLGGVGVQRLELLPRAPRREDRRGMRRVGDRHGLAEHVERGTESGRADVDRRAGLAQLLRPPW